MKMPNNNYRESSWQINVLKFISSLCLLIGIWAILSVVVGHYSGDKVIGEAFRLIIFSNILFVLTDLAQDVKEIKILLRSKDK